MRLQGKRALITGAARGIGLEFARAYIAEGATVALADINAEAVAKAAAALGPQAHAVQMDITRQDSIAAGFAEAVAKMGGLDFLVNNAALFSAAPLVEITRADYDKLFAVNVAGTLFCMQAAARQMIAQGQGGMGDALVQGDILCARHQQTKGDGLRIAIGKLRVIGLRKEEPPPFSGKIGQALGAVLQFFQHLVAQQTTEARRNLGQFARAVGRDGAPAQKVRQESDERLGGGKLGTRCVEITGEMNDLADERAVLPEAERLAVAVDEVRQGFQLLPLALIMRVGELAWIGPFAGSL